MRFKLEGRTFDHGDRRGFTETSRQTGVPQQHSGGSHMSRESARVICEILECWKTRPSVRLFTRQAGRPVKRSTNTRNSQYRELTNDFREQPASEGQLWLNARRFARCPPADPRQDEWPSHG